MKHFVKINSLAGLLSFAIICLIFFGSCANQGIGPLGGPRDSIPPVIVSSIPESFQTNFSGNQIEIAFNEYIVVDNLSEKIVFSPPLLKKPIIRIQGKSVIVKADEGFMPDRTYSVDFKDGIKDFTEGNKYENLRLVFSTSDRIDSMQIGGFILNASTLEAVENCWATIYFADNDSSFYNEVPEFISKTDKDGYFLFNNLPRGKFKLYGLTDNDNNLHYSQTTESIAFIDSLITPEATFIISQDTINLGKDTTISLSHTDYYPLNLNLRLFAEDDFDQYISSFKRISQDQCIITFNEKLAHAIHVQLLNTGADDKFEYVEFNQKKDSVNIWVTDSLFALKDTLLIKIVYPVTDSTGEFIAITDTLEMPFSESKVDTKKSADEKKEDDGNLFMLSTNLTLSNFDLNKNIIIEAPSPIEMISKNLITFNEIINDSIFKPVKFDIETTPGSKRKIIVKYTPVEDTKYIISIDTAVVKTLTGFLNIGFKTKFSTRKSDYYGSFTIEIQDFTGEGVIQLLKSSKKEELVSTIHLDSLQKSFNFNYLKPDKYIIKLIEDKNNNNEWDTGNLAEKLQPEPVYYFPKVIKVKSNWEFKEIWTIQQGTVTKKSILDDEPEMKNAENANK